MTGANASTTPFAPAMAKTSSDGEWERVPIYSYIHAPCWYVVASSYTPSQLASVEGATGRPTAVVHDFLLNVRLGAHGIEMMSGSDFVQSITLTSSCTQTEHLNLSQSVSKSHLQYTEHRADSPTTEDGQKDVQTRLYRRSCENDQYEGRSRYR